MRLYYNHISFYTKATVVFLLFSFQLSAQKPRLNELYGEWIIEEFIYTNSPNIMSDHEAAEMDSIANNCKGQVLSVSRHRIEPVYKIRGESSCIDRIDSIKFSGPIRIQKVDQDSKGLAYELFDENILGDATFERLELEQDFVYCFNSNYELIKGEGIYLKLLYLSKDRLALMGYFNILVLERS